jgi:hypothetical protein
LSLVPLRRSRPEVFDIRDALRFAGWYDNLESARMRWAAGGCAAVTQPDSALDAWITPDVGR